MEDTLTIAQDEIVAVFLGKGQDELSEFAQHPRVQWIRANSGRAPVEIIQAIPPSTKAFVFTDGIPHDTYHQLQAEAKRRRLTYLNRRNPRAVLGTLSELFPQDRKPALPLDKNFIQQFLDTHPFDPKKGNAEEARRLQILAREEGIPTTFGSLQQAISNRKRKLQQGSVPPSLQPTNPTDDALRTLDDAVASLQLLREWVAGTAARIASLEKKFAAYKALASD